MYQETSANSLQYAFVGSTLIHHFSTDILFPAAIWMNDWSHHNEAQQSNIDSFLWAVETNMNLTEANEFFLAIFVAGATTPSYPQSLL